MPSVSPSAFYWTISYLPDLNLTSLLFLSSTLFSSQFLPPSLQNDFDCFNEACVDERGSMNSSKIATRGWIKPLVFLFWPQLPPRFQTSPTSNFCQMLIALPAQLSNCDAFGRSSPLSPLSFTSLPSPLEGNTSVLAEL